MGHIYLQHRYRSYLKQSAYFLKWCKAQPVKAPLGRKPRTLDECKNYVSDWLNANIENERISAFTVSLRAAALAKLYQCTIADFSVVLPHRRRSDIRRSRNNVKNDAHFPEALHADLVTFCCCTGLRRAELCEIRGSDLVYIDGAPFLSVCRATKGGRPRLSPVVGTADEVATVVDMLKNAGENKLFHHVSHHADIHSYRAVYATRVYRKYARPIAEIKNERLIICNNKIVERYYSSNGLADAVGFAEYYQANGQLKKGFRDVSAKYVC